MTTKIAPMVLSTKINQFLTNIHSAPNLVIMKGYTDDLDKSMDDYLKTIDNTTPQYFQLAPYKAKISAIAQYMFINNTDGKILDEQYFSDYCAAVRSNMHDKNIWTMLASIFGC